MAIGGTKYFGYALWICWKQIQVWTRTSLSHALAVVLCVLVLIREWDELWRMEVRWPNTHEVLILVVTVFTILAAAWEHYGNKLASSPQEIRFVRGMRSLLFELERFALGKDREPDLDKRLNAFVEGFLEVTRSALCGDKSVDAALMIPQHDEDGDHLVLKMSSKGAHYPADLKVPIDGAGGGSSTSSPAGTAFQRLRLVYLPFKRWQWAWPFELTQNGTERYEPLDPTRGWVPAARPEHEDFCSVLCLPVAHYLQKNIKQRFGVLNYSAKALDPFVDRDFVMGECFASVLSLAFAIARTEASETARSRDRRSSADR